MKTSLLILLGAAALAGASFGLVGCVGEVGVGGPGYYDHGPYFYGHAYDHGGYYGGGWRR